MKRCRDCKKFMCCPMVYHPCSDPENCSYYKRKWWKMTIREYLALPTYCLALFFIWLTDLIAGDYDGKRIAKKKI